MTPGCLPYVILPCRQLFRYTAFQASLPWRPSSVRTPTHHNDLPAHLPQLLLLPCVAFNVSFELLIPEFSVGCRSACATTYINTMRTERINSRRRSSSIKGYNKIVQTALNMVMVYSDFISDNQHRISSAGQVSLFHSHAINRQKHQSCDSVNQLKNICLMVFCILRFFSISVFSLINHIQLLNIYSGVV